MVVLLCTAALCRHGQVGCTAAHRVIRVVPGQAGLLAVLALLGHKGVLNDLALGRPAHTAAMLRHPIDNLL